MSAPVWWSYLLVELAGVLRASVPVGLYVASVDLTAGEPHISVGWPGRSPTRLPVDPSADRRALLTAIGAVGPVRPTPERHDEEFWAPAPDADPKLGHAWLLDDLGRNCDAWYAYVPEPVELRRVRPDGRTAEVEIGRPARSDVVVVRLLISDWQLVTGCGYAVVERAVSAAAAEVSLILD